MQAALVLLVTLSLLAGVVCLIVGPQVAQAVTVGSAVVSLVLAAAIVGPVSGGAVPIIGFLRADAVSVVFLLATTFVYTTASIYSVGYLRHESGSADYVRYSRLFFAGLNIFAWAMIAAPLVDGLALLWVAIEITTVVSALLVAIDRTSLATEASWKYVLLASAGLGIALLATIVMYYAGSQVLGPSYDLGFNSLVGAASALPATPVRLAFVLAVVGFGTKVGLFPVHTWLPDAHAEAPTPISAMLSGALLATSFYAILRFYQVSVGALGAQFPRTVLLVFGILSLLLAALYLLQQHDVKRLLAYSSIEHMGILAIGIGFGAPLAAAGVLLHVLAHAAAKGSAFMGAGSIARKFGTKRIGSVRAGMSVLPWTGPLFVASVLALCAMPPFGIFRSEFQIIAGGLGEHHNVPAVLLVVLVTVAFLGLTMAMTRMMFEPAEAGATEVPSGELSRWMVAPMVLAVVALIVLGVHPPQSIVDLLTLGASQLGVPT